MFVAGLFVADDLILHLARLVNDPELADRLERAYVAETKVLALTVQERLAILAVLDDPPRGLEELRGVLLAAHTGRLRDGLA